MNPRLLVYKVLQCLASSDHSKSTIWVPALLLTCPCHALAKLNYFLFLQSIFTTFTPLYMLFPSLKTLFPTPFHIGYFLDIAPKWPTVTSLKLKIRFLSPCPPPIFGFVLFGNSIQFSKKERFWCTISLSGLSTDHRPYTMVPAFAGVFTIAQITQQPVNLSTCLPSLPSATALGSLYASQRRPSLMPSLPLPTWKTLAQPSRYSCYQG